MRCVFFNHRVQNCIQQYVIDNMGEAFVQPPVLEYKYVSNQLEFNQIDWFRNHIRFLSLFVTSVPPPGGAWGRGGLGRDLGGGCVVCS
jgi:hypothetical protein